MTTRHQANPNLYWIGTRAVGDYVNPRYYELLRRFEGLHRITLPAIRGFVRLEPVVAALACRRHRCLFGSPRMARYWRGPLIVDTDDPIFSESEISLLNRRRVRVVVTTTERLKARFIQAGVTRPVEVIPSGFSGRDLNASQSREVGAALNPQGAPVVGYAGGTLTLKEGDQGDITMLAQAIETVWEKRPDTQLWLLGRPSDEVRIWARQCPRAKLIGLVPRDRLYRYLQNFAVGTYPRRIDHQGRFSVKLMEYMGAGVPIVSSRVSETEIVEEAAAGFRARTTSDFADALVLLINDYQSREMLAANARNFARPYDWDALASRYEGEIFAKYC